MQAHPHTHTQKVQYSWREKEGKQGGKKNESKRARYQRDNTQLSSLKEPW